MSSFSRLGWAVLISIFLHVLVLISQSGRWGNRSGPFRLGGLLLVELINLGSRGAEASVAEEPTPFEQATPQLEECRQPQTPPALNPVQSAGKQPKPAVKKSDENQGPSSQEQRGLQPGESEGMEPSFPGVTPELEGTGRPGPAEAPAEAEENPEIEPNPAECANCPQPPYPAQALERGLEGEVELRVEILPDGGVGDIFVEQSSGYPILDEAALTGIKTWTFYPAMLPGNTPVGSTKQVKVVFSLGGL